MGQVDGKVAIVTGGASGIGAACAATLAREGAKVVVTDLDDIGGRDLVDKISGAGGEAIFLHQGRQPRGELAGCDRSHRTAFRALERDGRQRRYRHLVQGCRDVAGRLAPTNRGEPRRRVPVGEVRRSCEVAAPSSLCLRLPVSGARQVWPAIAPRKEACGCSQKRWQWNAPRPMTGSGSIRSIPGSSTRRSGRSYQDGGSVPIDPDEVAKGRGAARQGWTGSGHRKWRAVPRLGRVQLHDGRGAGDRRRHDRRRETSVELS